MIRLQIIVVRMQFFVKRYEQPSYSEVRTRAYNLPGAESVLAQNGSLVIWVMSERLRNRGYLFDRRGLY